MMANVGFGTTLSSAKSGAISGLKEVSVGGKTINMVNYALLNDENRASHNLTGVITSGPITATIVFSKAVYEALESNQVSAEADTWTLTDTDGNVWSGLGFISSLGEIPHTTDV